MNKLLYMFCLLLASSPSFAQDLRLDWNKVYGGGSGKEIFFRCLEATNGNLFAVGEANSKTAGGKDGYLVITDFSTGNVIKELRFGGAKDDVFYDVAQTFEGNFLLAGYTESLGKGGRDAWCVLLDINGVKLGEWVYGDTGSDEFSHIAIAENGSIVFSGIKNGQKEGDIWVGSWQNGKITTEGLVGAGEFGAASGLATAGSDLVLTGNVKKGGDVFLLKTSLKGEKRWSKTFGGKDWEESLGLTATLEGGFVIAGLTRSKGAGDLDAWLISASRDGSLLWDKTYGGSDMDLANGVVQLEDGSFALVGMSRSYRSGARKSKAYVVRVSSGGELRWQTYYGDGNDDSAGQATLLHDGTVVVSGSTTSFGAAGEDGWLFRLIDPLRQEIAMRDQIPVVLSDVKLASADGKSLTPGENTYLTFRIDNNSGVNLADLRVELDDRSGNQNFDAWTANYAGYLNNRGSKWIRIPVKAKKGLKDAENLLGLTVYAGSKNLQSIETKVITRMPAAASLQIVGFNFAPSTRSDEVTLTVQLENTGDFSTQPTDALINCPAGIQPVGPSSVPLGVVAAHSKREVRFGFQKTAQFRDPLANIVFVAREGGTEKLRKTLEWQAGGKATLASNGPIMIWTDPAPHEVGTNKFKKDNNQFEFKMTVVSPKPLTTKNFKLRVNGVEVEGSKFDETDLSAVKQEQQEYTYTFKRKTQLGVGESKFEVVVDDQISKPIFIEYAPERANLHILAIGPQHNDLKYTSKDAHDFASAFRGQVGTDKLYPQVFVTEATDAESSNLTGFKQALYDLSYQWKDGQIKANDVLILFISSHGKIVENRFKILQTGYNPKYDNLCIDFKSDILDILDGIKCKKIIFLDACHSGGAKDGYDGLSKAVIDLAKTLPGVSTLASCQSDEKSYESALWENGAFTESLLEAFSNKLIPEGNYRADANNDRVLRLGELYDFLQKRVPQLVKSAIPNAPTNQIPFMPGSQLDREMPIFLIK
jgi:hypothetical protein